MSLRGFAEDYPVAVLIVLLVGVIGAVAALSAIFVQGSIVAEDGCVWSDLRHPETNVTYSSVSEYKQAFKEFTGADQAKVDRYFQDKEFRVQDGVLQDKDCSNKREVGSE